MNPTEEKFLRKYLRRKISEKNKLFSSISIDFKDQAKTFRNEVFTYFARGAMNTFDYTVSNRNLKNIREHIHKNGQKFSPYNYFDLDTLIAYDAYWGDILNAASKHKEKSGKRRYSMSDFDSVLRYEVPKAYLKNYGKPETGFYNLDCPVHVLKDENNCLAPERTPDGKTFDEKYTTEYCEDLLKQYLRERHPEFYEEQENKVDPYYYDFIYCGIKYVIDTEKHYLTEEGFPIKYICAKSIVGNKDLVGFFDLDMVEYVGDIYSMEQHFLYSADQSGV